MRVATILTTAVIAMASMSVSAAELSVRKLDLTAPGGTLVSTMDHVLARAANGAVFEVTGDGSVIDKSGAVQMPEPGPLPLPLVKDGRVAISPDGRIKAWYNSETESYGHGALGDPVEALSLVVQEESGAPAIYTVTADEVFEDLEPRIVDLDREQQGRPEIVAITASSTGGAGIAVFGLGRDSDGNPALLRLASSARIGAPYRWLNIAGIADFDGDGFTEIAYVDRPHIRGELVFLEWRGGRLREQAREGGYANHHGGSTVQDLSEIADVDDDGNPDLILPVRGYGAIVAVSLTPDGPRRIAEVKIPSAPLSSIVSTSPQSAVYLDRDGALYEIRWAP
ncbi:FG-GAP repeat domain-containing protein [Nisaea nitritireducens]|uniref:FG-GAP repeat domain-containing protein n=1 Tax=Nisaea nitritireducens TaxID=568392 RepID=UPI00186693EA|nr:VCBS repeat-containing protein [Nisaea nitritireducens]